MNKIKLLNPISTQMLISWYHKAESGNGKFIYFDKFNLSTVNFTKHEILNELKTREDLPTYNKKDPRFDLLKKMFEEMQHLI